MCCIFACLFYIFETAKRQIHLTNEKRFYRLNWITAMLSIGNGICYWFIYWQHLPSPFGNTEVEFQFDCNTINYKVALCNFTRWRRDICIFIELAYRHTDTRPDSHLYARIHTYIQHIVILISAYISNQSGIRSINSLIFHHEAWHYAPIIMKYSVFELKFQYSRNMCAIHVLTHKMYTWHTWFRTQGKNHHKEISIGRIRTRVCV